MRCFGLPLAPELQLHRGVSCLRRLLRTSQGATRCARNPGLKHNEDSRIEHMSGAPSKGAGAGNLKSTLLQAAAPALTAAYRSDSAASASAPMGTTSSPSAASTISGAG